MAKKRVTKKEVLHVLQVGGFVLGLSLLIDPAAQWFEAFKPAVKVLLGVVVLGATMYLFKIK